jgi:hypothetical protein
MNWIRLKDKQPPHKSRIILKEIKPNGDIKLYAVFYSKEKLPYFPNGFMYYVYDNGTELNDYEWIDYPD